MKYYLCKLLPPRASFPQDMTPREAEIMQAHAAYCGKLLEAGKAIVFGPVADPQAIVADDPVIKANAGFAYQVMPMLRAATRENCAS